MMNRSDIDTMTGAARGMAEAQREAREAAVENFMSMQQRSTQLAREGLKFIELQRESAGAVRDFWSSGARFMEIHQRNADFAQRWISEAYDATRAQAEQNLRTAEVFAKSARAQQENFQTFAGTWAGAYHSCFSPFVGYAHESMEVARKATEQGAEQGMRLVDEAASQSANGVRGAALISALENSSYDEMNVGDITKNLDGLSGDELRKVRTYEKRHKNRDTLVEQIDRKIKANS